MEIIRSTDPKTEAGSALTESLRAQASKPILLMLSGGSAWSLLDAVPAEVLGGHVTLVVLDERFSTDEQVNNFAQLQATDFYQRALAAKVSFISTKVKESDEVTEVRDNFSEGLLAWRAGNPDGVVIATMGIGPDGHTAGVMPGCGYEVDFAGEDLVVAYTVPEKVNPHTMRITTTYTFLRGWVDEAIVYAVGIEKQSYLKKLATETSDLKLFPAGILREMKSVKVFTDLG